MFDFVSGKSTILFFHSEANLKEERWATIGSEKTLCSVTIRKDAVKPADLIGLNYFGFIIYLQLSAEQTKAHAAHISLTVLSLTCGM